VATEVRSVGAGLVVVGRTNARALSRGYAGPVERFDTRDQAVAWVRSSLVRGDGVLYLNDLPTTTLECLMRVQRGNGD